MARFAANVSMLFTEAPFLERFELAAKAGFEAVEFQFPYAFDPREIRRRLDACRLPAVLHNLPAGDWAQGDRGIACHPGRVAEFRAGVRQAIDCARLLGVPQLNCLAGKPPADADDGLVRATLRANLAYAAAKLKAAGLRLLIEPINTFDVPGFYLNRTQQAADLLAEVGADNLLIQLDIYHAHRMEGEVAATIARHLPSIGHLQIADHPGRHEPGSGEIGYAELLPQIDRLGYRGWIGCEYLPATTTEEGLSWRERLCDR